MILQELKDSYRYREVVYNYVYTTLTVKYKRSVIGYFWTILAPLLRYFVMGSVFYYVGRQSNPQFYPHMFTGSVFFGFFQSVFLNGTTVFINNEHYIKKIYIPKLTFVLNLVLYELVNFWLILIGLLFIGLLTGQVELGKNLPWIVIPITLALFFLTGIALLLGIATLYFRDLTQITDVLTQCLFFASPILAFPEQLPQIVIRWNPIFYFLEVFRAPLIYNQAPLASHVMVCAVLSMSVFSAGLFMLRRFSNRIVFKL